MQGFGLQPGAIFAGDFRVISPLSEGGMGAVYVVEQLSTATRRALKLMRPELLANASLRQRFVQEARVGGRIRSDHVVQVVGAGVDAATSVPWLAMELLEGESLAATIERRTVLSTHEVAEIFAQLCHALGAAHAAGIVHRDLKPENVFLETPRRAGVPFTVKVLDFGIAKLVADAQTHQTAAIGTPLWMAPEQTEAGGRIVPATDVWALGLIAFRLLTGRFYWRVANTGSASAMALMREVVFEPIVPASVRASELGVSHLLPPGFDGWFARAVERDIDRRFPDATVAQQTLAPLLSGAPALALPPPPPPPPVATTPYTPPPTAATVPMHDASVPPTPSREPEAWKERPPKPPANPAILFAVMGALVVVGIATAVLVLRSRSEKPEEKATATKDRRPSHPSVSLPTSNAKTTAPDGAMWVALTDRELLAQGAELPVASRPEGDGASGFDAKDKENGSPNDLGLRPLRLVLETHEARDKTPILFEIDRTASYRMVVEIVFTAGQAGYKDFWLAVAGDSGKHAIRLNVPRAASAKPAATKPMRAVIARLGIFVSGSSAQVAPGCDGVGTGPAVPRLADTSGANAGYDFAAFTKCLRKVKNAVPDTDTDQFTLGATPETPYAHVVLALDAMRSDAEGPLFPDVALLAPSSPETIAPAPAASVPTPSLAPAAIDAGLALKVDPSKTPAEKVPSGEAATGTASNSGGSIKDADSTIARNRWRFKACYSKCLASDSKCAGKVTVSVRVGEGGEVISASSTSSTAPAALTSCIVSSFNSMKFSPPDGGSATLTVPVVFTAKTE